MPAVAAPSIAFADIPANRVTNTTAKRQYQRVCSWVNTCAACGQYHGMVHGFDAAVPRIPIHINCECKDLIIEPGETSVGYPGLEDIAPELAPVQQQRLMGKANYELWQSGTVDFKDIVQRRTILPFQTVVAKVQTPASLLKGSPESAHARLADWFTKNAGLSKQAAGRAATARMNRVDMAKAIHREFLGIADEFSVTLPELKKLFTERMADKIWRGEASLRTVVVTVYGVDGSRYLSGELTADELKRKHADRK